MAETPTQFRKRTRKPLDEANAEIRAFHKGWMAGFKEAGEIWRKAIKEFGGKPSREFEKKYLKRKGG